MADPAKSSGAEYVRVKTAPRADTVFILTGWCGVQDPKEKASGWSESEIKRWKEKLEKTKLLLKKENEARRATGEHM